jgi:putative ferrous iron transport protein C
MILAELKDYIKERRQVSLADLVNRFDTDENALRQMLEVWIHKGRIHKRLSTPSCGSSCNQCGQGSTEYYCWGSPPARTITFFSDQCSIRK